MSLSKLNRISMSVHRHVRVLRREVATRQGTHERVLTHTHRPLASSKSTLLPVAPSVSSLLAGTLIPRSDLPQATCPRKTAGADKHSPSGNAGGFSGERGRRGGGERERGERNHEHKLIIVPPLSPATPTPPPPPNTHAHCPHPSPPDSPHLPPSRVGRAKRESCPTPGGFTPLTGCDQRVSVLTRRRQPARRG
jgi:hypothetical protein